MGGCDTAGGLHRCGKDEEGPDAGEEQTKEIVVEFADGFSDA